jgi:transcriptional regulator with XRE-family HTH domain
LLNVPYGIASLAMSLSDKFREWLGKQTGSRAHGWKTEVAELVGLDRSYVNKVLNKKRPGRLRLEALEQMAEHLHCKAWQVVWMIEHGVPDLPVEMRSRRSP